MSERKRRGTSLPGIRKNPASSFVFLSLHDCTDPGLHMIDAEMEMIFEDIETESQGGEKKGERPCRIEDHCNHQEYLRERTITCSHEGFACR